MNKTIITTFSILLSVSSYGQNAKQRFSVNPADVRQGNAVAIGYNAEGSDLEYSDELKAAVYIFQSNSWRVDTTHMQKAGKGWKTTYQVPADAGFLAFKFYQGSLARPEAADHNGLEGFLAAVRDKAGKIPAGTALAEAQLFQAQTAASNIYNYFGQDVDTKLSHANGLLEKERKTAGTDIYSYLPFYFRLKSKALGEKQAKALCTDIAEKLLSDPRLGEEKLAVLHRLASFNLKDEALASKIRSRIMSEFPGGSEARFIAFSGVKRADPDPKVRISSYEHFLAMYPADIWRKRKDGKGFMYYETYRSLGSAYFETRQYDKFTELFKQMDFRSANEVWRWNLTRGQMMDEMQKGSAADTLLRLAEATIPFLYKLKTDGSYSEDFDSPKAAQENADRQLDERLFTLIFLQNKTKHFDRAAKSFSHLSAEGLYSNADLNAIHLNVLENTGEHTSILPLLEMSARRNAMTPGMIAKLKELYAAGNNQNTAGFDEYYRSLASPEARRELLAHVKENLVNHPYTPFELEDARGAMVNSEDWKDKIVIIDFWATWCRPCIMAFPGMQLVVDKYAADPNVLVYFIGTMQTGDYKAKSVDYVTRSGFRFNLLHDAPNTKNGEQDAVFKSMVPFFGSSAIPRKIIVQNGIIKYSSEGYSGSPSKLLDELSIAVDMIKNSK